MEALNFSISAKFQSPNGFSIFTPKPSITALNCNTPCRFLSTHLKFRPKSPPWTSSRYVSRRTFLVSAHFGRPTNRRNSLRRKLIGDLHVPKGPTNPDPVETSADNAPLHSNSSSGAQEKGSQGSGVVEQKSLGKSSLLSRLESWLNQFKEDIDFWGVGSGPIFTIYNDSNGNVESVSVDVDEIVMRCGVVPEYYKKNVELVDFREVNLRIDHAKGLAKEMECGNHVLPLNSSLTKFVVSGEISDSVCGIGSFGLCSNIVPRMSGWWLGIGLASGFVLLCAVEEVIVSGASKRVWDEVTSKMWSKMEKEKEKKGTVEVLQEAIEAPKVISQRPPLDKDELWNSIRKAKASYTVPGMLDNTSIQDNSSSRMDFRIQEIRKMARHALQVEREEQLKINSAEQKEPASSDFSSSEEVWHNEEKRMSSLVRTEYQREIRNVNAVVGTYLSGDIVSDDAEISGDSRKTTDPNGGAVLQKIESDDAKINGDSRETREFKWDVEAESLEKTESDGPKLGGQSGSESKAEMQLLSSSSPRHIGDQTDINLDSGNSDENLNLSDLGKESQSSGISTKPLSLSNELVKKKKPRIMLSVNEAREYLSKKRRRQVIQGKPVSEDRQEVTMTSNQLSTERMQIDNKYGATEAGAVLSGLGGMPDSTLVTIASESSCSADYDHVSTGTVGRQEIHVINFLQASAPDLVKNETSCREMEEGIELEVKDNKAFNPNNSGDLSDSIPSGNDLDGSFNVEKICLSTENDDLESSGGKHEVDHLPYTTSKVSQTVVGSAEMAPLIENWVEKNFHELEPVIKKVGAGFRNNYVVARDTVNQETDAVVDIANLRSLVEANELEWMKDDGLREIVFKVRDNELAGLDPFHLMDAEDKVTFFKGLERKAEQENEKLLKLHQWLHSNIENLDYGAEGISLHDPLEKIMPRWKGPPTDKISEFLNSKPPEQQNSAPLQKANISVVPKSDSSSNEIPNAILKPKKKVSKCSKTFIQSSDGSVRPAKKQGKEQWEHTKKWSREFLESYNAEQDPEIKAIMRDLGKDLDRWITEDEIRVAGDLMKKVSGKTSESAKKRLNKLKNEMEIFGPHAVVSKYREYSEEKVEDYLWWLDLPFVLCLELHTQEEEGGEMKIGFYSLEMAADLELDPKPHNVIAFENPADCKNLCYIIQAHMEMLGSGRAFVVAQPPKDVFRHAKANGFGVTVIRKGQLQLNIDQPLEEVEEMITETGSKMYHDKMMRERSVNIRSLMKGVFGHSKLQRRRSSKQRLKKNIKR